MLIFKKQYTCNRLWDMHVLQYMYTVSRNPYMGSNELLKLSLTNFALPSSTHNFIEG